MEKRCSKCGGLLIPDEDFIYSFIYHKCFSCSKRYFDTGDKMEILIKIPTRGRPEQFFAMLELYIKNLRDKDKTKFLITADIDDESMNNDQVKEYIKIYCNTYEVDMEITFGESQNKIHAINRDLSSCFYYNWDVLVLASDDMLPIFEGYDEIIRRDMEEHFPDRDGVLYYPDGYTNLNTLPILGRKYYERFDYIYNPEYKSFFCDNLFHEVADILQKQYHGDIILFKHEHPANIGNGWDEVYEKNNTSWDEDKQTYINHRVSGYKKCLGK
jgi:hypothetical protein